MANYIGTIRPLIPVLIVFLSITGCRKAETSEIPSCISSKIAEMKAAEVTNPPGSLWQYEYNGQQVYYIPPVCCDIPGQLYDDNCNLICYPDGGISGAGDGNCTDFFANRKSEKLIWQDDRQRTSSR